MNSRLIGDMSVSEIGLGTMALSLDGRPDESTAIEVICSGLDSGITFLDTADCYCLDSESEHGHSERLIAKALKEYKGEAYTVKVATKGGKRKPREGVWPIDGKPSYLKSACEQSLKNLGVEIIDLYQLHAPDPNVPLEDSLGALVELKQEGKINNIGVSNFNLDQLNLALNVAPIVSVQNSLSPFDKTSLDLIEFCTMFGIALIAYSPLGGRTKAKELGGKLHEYQYIAGTHNATAQQIALAWELNLSHIVVPIPSCRSNETVQSCAEASEIKLSSEEMVLLTNSIEAEPN
jgi:aryl-alcohol dehydrogenase-like predicted oxidoreductase